MATKADCIAAFGSPTAQGRYPFLRRGSSAYNLYVRDLYRRVYHRDGEDETTIPWHFARGCWKKRQGIP
jgi:hypothetical protein